jgi:hypothetical protein
MTTGPIGATGIAAFDRATGPTGANNVTAAVHTTSGARADSMS